jgi:hypothetical protein
MAYLLRFNASGTNDRVDVVKSINFTDVTFEWTGSFSILAGADRGLFQRWIGDFTGNTRMVCWYDNPLGLQFVIQRQGGSQITTTGITGLSVGVDYKVSVNVRSGIDVRIYLDDVLQQTITTTETFADIPGFSIGDHPSGLSRPFRGDLKSFRILDNNSISSLYDPSASNGTGSTLIDTVGGNNGTLVNFPTDGSQWGFYDAPTDDVDSSIAATWPSLAVSVSQSQELPAGTTADIALTWPSLSVGANQSATTPEYSSTVAATWPSLSVSASQSATVPEYSTSVNAAWPSLLVSVSQGQAIPAVGSSVNVTWPALSISASQAQSIPSVSADVSATWPSLVIAADQTQQLPAGATSVSVTWPSLSVSASQSATVPTTTADVSATWPSLSVSAGIDVSVPVGGASVSVTWPSLAVSVSQSATAPTLSQINVTWPSLTASAEQASTVPEYAATISTTWPSLAVSVIAGEFDYATDPDAKITIYKESRKITIVTPSRRIEL